MQIRIQTGDAYTDALLQAAIPLWEARLAVLSGGGTVLITGDRSVTEQTPDEASVVMVLYRQESWLADPLHKKLTETLPYAALPWPVSLADWEKAILQMDTGRIRETRPSDIRLIPEENLVCSGGRSVRLTDREFGLFSLLYENRGQIISRETMTASVWPDGVEGNACEVHMTHLRKKLVPLLGEGVIGSIRGKGYIMR